MKVENENLWSHRRLALIIGNENYRTNRKLTYSINNTKDLAVLLQQMHFQVTLHENVESDIIDVVSDFAKKIKDGDFILFYYSGYGFQFNEENFLIPTDDVYIQTEEDVSDCACRVNSVINRLTRGKHSYATVCIFDCSHPYLIQNDETSEYQTKNKGLCEIKPPENTFIQFSCDQNKVSAHKIKADRHSLFTKHLLQNISKDNYSIKDIFRNVKRTVYRESRQQQKPLSIDNLKDSSQIILNKQIINEAINEAIESLIEHLFEQITENIIDEVVDRSMDKIVTQIVAELCPKPYTITQYNQIIEELKSKCTRLLNNGAEYSRSKSVRLKKTKALVDALVSSRNERIRNEYSLRPVETQRCPRKERSLNKLQ